MAERPGPNDPSALVAAHNLLQQALITTQARLDRQVAQLMRLNRLSNHLIDRVDQRPVGEIFAEAIVDVLDVALGAVWILPPVDRFSRRPFAVFGASPPETDWSRAGTPLAARLPQTGKAIMLEGDLRELLPGVDLHRVLACCCVGRDGHATAVVLAANTAGVDSMSVPLEQETAEMLTVLAEKCAAHIDNALDRRVIEQQVASLRESQEQLELVLRGTNDGWWDWDIAGDTCFLSSRWMEMVGPHGAGAVTRKGFWHDRVHAEDRERFEEQLQRAFVGADKAIEIEVLLHRDDGSCLPVLVRGTILRSGDGRPVRMAGTIFDLTDRKRYEDHIHQLAFYDMLTDLPNRRLLVDRLQQSLLARARTGQVAALLMLDIDRFKWLNDTHGHAAGDQLLKSLAVRLRELVRPYDTVARLGGDEFVVLLEQLGTDPQRAQATAQRVAAKVLNAMDQPYELSVGTVHHSVSIGVVLSTAGELGADGMLRAADVALYQAKQDGKNIVRLFLPAMQEQVDSRSALEARLRHAFTDGSLRVHYQAQVDEAGRLVGAEALLRWTDQNQRPIAPSDFIRVAEESGFIHTLGCWTLQHACEQAVQWRGRVPEGFRIAVNLSPPEFTRPDFVERVLEILARTGAHGSELRLEITERTVVQDMHATVQRMNALIAHGIEFSLDDFGSGSSPFVLLQELPVREVKIDQNYVRRIMDHPKDAAIVRAILAMCHAVRLRVIAEGVETTAQMSLLGADGCRFYQGYLFGRPVASSADPLELLEVRTVA
jgi:diguanylate cyclase (GGDEF)-like protein/PAS domain S-box-containing protein